MRRHGIPEPYEKLKALTRGRPITADVLQEFIGALDLPETVKEQLLALTPGSYTGNASAQAGRGLSVRSAAMPLRTLTFEFDQQSFLRDVRQQPPLIKMPCRNGVHL